MNIVEVIGYVASILVAVSLTMSKILRLRIINLLGALAFTIYGFFLGAIPIFLVNGFIVIIDIYYLYKLIKHSDDFDILHIDENHEYLTRFLNHYENDIKVFFPNFKEDNLKGNINFFILRNMQPVNLVSLNKQGNGIVEVVLDYTLRPYRDFLNGKYLLTVVKKVIDGGSIIQLVTKPESKAHIKYLKKIGFNKNDMGLYVTKIT